MGRLAFPREPAWGCPAGTHRAAAHWALSPLRLHLPGDPGEGQPGGDLGGVPTLPGPPELPDRRVDSRPGVQPRDDPSSGVEPCQVLADEGDEPAEASTPPMFYSGTLTDDCGVAKDSTTGYGFLIVVLPTEETAFWIDKSKGTVGRTSRVDYRTATLHRFRVGSTGTQSLSDRQKRRTHASRMLGIRTRRRR